jgi:hypothetical protein
MLLLTSAELYEILLKLSLVKEANENFVVCLGLGNHLVYPQILRSPLPPPLAVQTNT